jgi:L-fuculose-phosphate aldolase
MNFFKERHTVVDLCLELSHRGYFAATGGNIAIRVDASHMAVTPSATDYFSMTAEDICIVKIADLEQVDGDRNPSVESGLHARVLRDRPDVQCSIHTHQPTASACALLGKALKVPPELQTRIGLEVPVAGYAPSGSGWLTSLVGKQLRPGVNAYLMRNHGVLCCGRDPMTAMATVEDLELVARRHLRDRIEARSRTAAPVLRKALQRLSEDLARSSH